MAFKAVDEAVAEAARGAAGAVAEGARLPAIRAGVADAVVARVSTVVEAGTAEAVDGSADAAVRCGVGHLS